MLYLTNSLTWVPPSPRQAAFLYLASAAQPLIGRAGVCALYCGFTTSRVNCPARQLYIHLRRAVLKKMWYILQSSMSIAKTFQSWDD